MIGDLQAFLIAMNMMLLWIIIIIWELRARGYLRMTNVENHIDLLSLEAIDLDIRLIKLEGRLKNG